MYKRLKDLEERPTMAAGHEERTYTSRLVEVSNGLKKRARLFVLFNFSHKR